AAAIYREYLLRAVLEQAIGEPAGGGAEVNGHGPFHLQLKVNQGVFQLVAAAADVFIPGLEFDPVVRADRVAGFVGGVPVDFDEAGQDGALGLFPAFAQTAFNESVIEAGHVESGRQPSGLWWTRPACAEAKGIAAAKAPPWSWHGRRGRAT